MIEQMRLAGARIGTAVAIIGLDAVPRLAGEYAMDAQQSDAAASRSRVRSGVPVWAWSVGEPHGRWADRSVFCAGGGDGFSARAGDESGTLRLGSACHAAHVVGTGAGGFALEPGIVCGDEVPMLLLFGFGVGADAWAGG